MDKNAEKSKEILVFISHKDEICDECGKELYRSSLITFCDDKLLCLSCADLDHLSLLYSGNAALTRRAKKYSGLWAVVLKWSRARKRNERQGLLVEEQAILKAEGECLADQDLRERRREREAARREILDQEYTQRFAQKICQMYPQCPPDTADLIAGHACEKFSGRIGRSSAAKELDTDAVTLAVTAHIRHNETKYDELLMQGIARYEARELTRDEVKSILSAWKAS